MQQMSDHRFTWDNSKSWKIKGAQSPTLTRIPLQKSFPAIKELRIMAMKENYVEILRKELEDVKKKQGESQFFI